jgi:hypothetical protein
MRMTGTLDGMRYIALDTLGFLVWQSLAAENALADFCSAAGQFHRTFVDQHFCHSEHVAL